MVILLLGSFSSIRKSSFIKLSDTSVLSSSSFEGIWEYSASVIIFLWLCDGSWTGSFNMMSSIWNSFTFWSQYGSTLNMRQYKVTPSAHISAALPLCVSILGSQHSGAKKWKVPAVFDILSFESKGLLSFSLTPKSQYLAMNGTPSCSSYGKCLLVHKRIFWGFISLWIIPALLWRYVRPLIQSFKILSINFWQMNLSCVPLDDAF